MPLYELWQAASHASPHHLTDDQRREMALAFRDHHMPGATLLVASGRDGLCGCLGYEEQGGVAVVEGLWIDPQNQGEGVGRAFIDRLKTEHFRIEAVVNAGALDLLGFYDALGFETASRDGADGEGTYPDVKLVWTAHSA